MTDQEFQNALQNFKFYLKPAMFTVLVENADIFSAETKREIITKLKEADHQTQELHEYQEKRNGIVRKGIRKMEDIYKKAKATFMAEGVSQKDQDSAAADLLISNM